MHKLQTQALLFLTFILDIIFIYAFYSQGKCRIDYEMQKLCKSVLSFLGALPEVKRLSTLLVKQVAHSWELISYHGRHWSGIKRNKLETYNNPRMPWPSFVRNGISQNPVQIYSVRNSGGGAPYFLFIKLSCWFCCFLKFENHCL